MSDVHLRAMRADEWDAWYASRSCEYADDLVRNESLTREQAMAHSSRRPGRVC